MTNHRLSQLLKELKAGLKAIYGSRLKGLFLFGSYARGEQGDDSDIDVLIVLDEINHYGAEVDRTGDLASDLSIKEGATISRVFVSENEWRKKKSSFLLNVHEEAVPA